MATDSRASYRLLLNGESWARPNPIGSSNPHAKTTTEVCRCCLPKLDNRWPDQGGHTASRSLSSRERNHRTTHIIRSTENLPALRRRNTWETKLQTGRETSHAPSSSDLTGTGTRQDDARTCHGRGHPDRGQMRPTAAMAACTAPRPRVPSPMSRAPPPHSVAAPLAISPRSPA